MRPLLLAALAGLLLAGCTEPNGGHEVEPVQEHQIAIHNMQYNPGTLTMAAGEALRFENHEGVAHTATAMSSPMGNLESGDIAPNGGGHAFTDMKAGTYTFTCRHHASMRLTVSVTAAA